MCGINGFNTKDENKIHRMMKATHHRGPDGEGFFCDELVSLGHNLLAIADRPELGKQPYYSKDGNFVLIYNGEIYNYKVLRKELEEEGAVFHTEGDTEVLLAGLEKYGIEFVKKLDGMFAFAFYDKKSKTVTIARDRMGMKPVYYFYKDGDFIFSSELRGLFASGIPRTLNLEMANVFFELGYVPGYSTLVQNVHKVCPGEYITYNLEKKLLKNAWFVESNEVPQQEFDDEELRKIFGDSVLSHTMGLRPFGMFLSGGLDSSIVLHELHKKNVPDISTYTTRFDVKEASFNEDADLAKKLSVDYGTHHHELLVTEKKYIDAIPKVISAIEEPRYNPSVAQGYLLAQFASEKLIVVLTGDGGDEMFMGYSKYYESKRISDRYAKYPQILVDLFYTLNHARKGIIPPNVYLNLHNALTRWWSINKISFEKENTYFTFSRSTKKVLEYLRSIDAPEIEHPIQDIDNAVASLDRLFWLADESFIRTDKIGMHFGIETRYPMVDRTVLDYANSIPSLDKLSAPGTKGLVRQAYKNELPEYILQKKKSGWKAPARVWVESELGDMIDQILSKDFYKETSGLFDFDVLRQKKDRLKDVFPVLTFQLWAKEFGITY